MHLRNWIVLGIFAVVSLPHGAEAQSTNRPETPPGLEDRPSASPGQSGGQGPSGSGGTGNSQNAPSSQSGSAPGRSPSEPQSLGPASSQGSNLNAAPGLTIGIQEIQQAVAAGQVVPFASVLGEARRATGGELIGGKLMIASGGLVYELLMLDDAGSVQRLHFAASTGKRIVR